MREEQAFAVDGQAEEDFCFDVLNWSIQEMESRKQLDTWMWKSW